MGAGSPQVGNARIVLDVYLGEIENGGDLHANEHSELRWVDARGLTELDWPDADVPIVPLVQAQMRSA